MSLSFAGNAEQEGKDALLDVRSDSTDTNWCLFSYEGPKSQSLVLVGKGSGGVEEMKEHLKDDIVGYGFVRKSEKIDDSTTVKFAFIMWLPDKVPRMQKARISVHKGSVQDFIGQVHVDIQGSVPEDVTDEIIESAISTASGTRVHVLADEVAATRIGGQKKEQWVPRSSTATKVAEPPKTLSEQQSIKLLDEASFKAELKEVRSDENDTNWFAAGYEGKKGNTLISLGKGSGGLDEVIPLFKDDEVVYVLLRETEKIDESETVKFVFIEWTGDEIDRMHRARLSTHKGAVTNLFAPYHVDILQASKHSEVTQDIIQQRIKEAAGTFNKVKS